MRSRSMFHTFVVVMAVLTFSAPFTLLAQQVPMQTQTEFAAAQDTNTMRLDVKTAAKRHINHDLAGSPGHSCIEFFVDGLVRPWIEDRVSSLGHSWIERYGCISPIVGTSLGCIIGAMIDPEDEGGLDSFGLVGPTKGMMVGALIGGCIGVAVPLIWMSANNPSRPPPPSPKRLLGKPPEYIEFYTNAYRK